MQNQLFVLMPISKYRKLNKAPISKSERDMLLADRANIKGAAQRKGVTLDDWDEQRESNAAKNNFELGCWLFLAAKSYSAPAEDRAEFLRRIFISGRARLDYDFFTIFNFGERQFDSLLEQGDGDLIIDILRNEIPGDKTGGIKRAFNYHGWVV
ncbi:MAG: hypothetical protein ABTQ25_06105 [Nitrosomonas ureae]